MLSLLLAPSSIVLSPSNLLKTYYSTAALYLAIVLLHFECLVGGHLERTHGCECCAYVVLLYLPPAAIYCLCVAFWVYS